MNAIDGNQRDGSTLLERMERSARWGCLPGVINCWQRSSGSSWKPTLNRDLANILTDARPGRACHTALQAIRHAWPGTIWFIEGDISKCFERLDHDLLIAPLGEHFHDERFIRLIQRLLDAGY